MQLCSCGELESSKERRRRTEILVHRPDDCLSVEEREIIDANAKDKPNVNVNEPSNPISLTIRR